MMGERYYITGVQLGMLAALPTMEEREEVVHQIVTNQGMFNLDAAELVDVRYAYEIPKQGLYECPECGDRFNDELQLSTHKELEHELIEEEDEL